MGTKRKADSDSDGPALTKRACDLCHSRKVKCDGQVPCLCCRKAGVGCTYLNPVRAKGPVPKYRKVSTSSAVSPRTVSPRRVRFDISEWVNCVSGLSSPALPGDDPFGIGGLGPVTNHIEDTLGPSQVDPFALPDTIDPSASIDASTQALVRAQPPYTPLLPLDPFSSATPMWPNQTSFPSCQPDPTTFWSSPYEHAPDVSPILTLTLDNLIRPQLEIFFQRIFPMIPIFHQSEVSARLADPGQLRSKDFVSMVLSMTALSLIHPLQAHEIPQRHTRAKQAKFLMDEACRLRATWDHGCDPTTEGVVASFCMFGALFELGQAAGARMRLKEAVSMGEAMHLDQPQQRRADAHELRRRTKLFHMLAVTERAYALQRAGHLVFNGSIALPASDSSDPTGTHIRLLARVFSHINQDIVHCWNGRCAPADCSLTRSSLVNALANLSGPANKVFGDADGLQSLSEIQKADLLVTWQWLRNRLWRLASTHGHTGEDQETELSADYVVEVAATTVEICKRLSTTAMEAHGTGFVEKLYDIASIVPELLQSGHELSPRILAIAQTDQWDAMFSSLSFFVKSHRQGQSFADQLIVSNDFVGQVKLLLAGT